MMEKVVTINLIQINFLNGDKLPLKLMHLWVHHIYRDECRGRKALQEKATEFSGSSFHCCATDA